LLDDAKASGAAASSFVIPSAAEGSAVSLALAQKV
jgi:hypothetical protein